MFLRRVVWVVDLGIEYLLRQVSLVIWAYDPEKRKKKVKFYLCT